MKDLHLKLSKGFLVRKRETLGVCFKRDDQEAPVPESEEVEDDDDVVMPKSTAAEPQWHAVNVVNTYVWISLSLSLSVSLCLR